MADAENGQFMDVEFALVPLGLHYCYGLMNSVVISALIREKRLDIRKRQHGMTVRALKRLRLDRPVTEGAGRAGRRSGNCLAFDKDLSHIDDLKGFHFVLPGFFNKGLVSFMRLICGCSLFNRLRFHYGRLVSFGSLLGQGGIIDPLKEW